MGQQDPHLAGCDGYCRRCVCGGDDQLAYFVIDHDINATYVAIHPAHGVLTAEPFDEALVKVAGRLPNVEEAEGRVVLGGMNILLGDDKKHPLSMTAVKDLSDLRLDQMKLLSGAWPGKLEMVVPSNEYAQEGDLVQVELPDGRIRELHVSSVVQDQGGSAVAYIGSLPTWI